MVYQSRSMTKLGVGGQVVAVELVWNVPSTGSVSVLPPLIVLLSLESLWNIGWEEFASPENRIFKLRSIDVLTQGITLIVSWDIVGGVSCVLSAWDVEKIQSVFVWAYSILLNIFMSQNQSHQRSTNTFPILTNNKHYQNILFRPVI